MPTTCKIEFENNPSQVVYSGQLLRGTVHLTLTSAKNIRGAYIKITGSAYAHWSEGTGDNKKSYTGSEDYLNERSYLVGGTSGEIQLQPGSYHYSFQSYLPPQLPTSFEGDYGYIRYNACVVLDIPMWPDKEFETIFTVIKAINLNADPTLREPVIVKNDKTFFPCFLLCCCESAPLEIVARSPVGGYVPGQTINFEFIVSNRSDQPVNEFTLQLIRQITYHVYANSSRKKEETIVITEQEARGCQVNQDDVINICIRVPAIPPTDNTTSNIIKTRYFCRVIGSVDCCHSDPVLMLPIVIGTYPLLDEPVSQLPRTMATLPTIPSLPQTNGTVVQQPTISPTAPQFSGESNTSPPPYPSAPIQFPHDEPPTYEDAIKQGKNKDDGGFVPKYPMFTRQTSYSQ